MKAILFIAFSLLLLWLCANVAHWLWIVPRMRRWERKTTKNAECIPVDAVPYTMGCASAAILFIHGFADKPAVFKGMATSLSNTFTCRCLSLRDSSSWIETVRREFEALKQTHATVWVCGHSMGGAIAVAAQLDHVIHADGLILLAPLFDVSRHRLPLLSPRLGFRVAKTVLRMTPYLESAFPVNVLTCDGDAIAYRRDRFIPYSTYEALFALTDMIRARGAEITVPVFMALAEGDRVVQTPAAERWMADVATRKETVTLRDCGHAIPLEAQYLPHLCDMIRDFFTAPS